MSFWAWVGYKGKVQNARRRPWTNGTFDSLNVENFPVATGVVWHEQNDSPRDQRDPVGPVESESAREQANERPQQFLLRIEAGFRIRRGRKVRARADRDQDDRWVIAPEA